MSARSATENVQDNRPGRSPSHQEIIQASIFDRLGPTPALDRAVAHVAAILTDAVDDGLTVVQGPILNFSDTTTLNPSLAVYADDKLPVLVAEVQMESTERLLLGPKRLIYAQHGISEYLVIRPVHHLVVQLSRQDSGRDYPWPPSVYGTGDVLSLKSLPSVSITVDRLFLPELPSVPGFAQSAEDEESS